MSLRYSPVALLIVASNIGCVGSVPNQSVDSADSTFTSDSIALETGTDAASDVAIDTAYMGETVDAASIGFLTTIVPFSATCDSTLKIDASSDDNATYYVSTKHGSDDASGFIDDPLATISAAITKARADTKSHIVIDIGTYNESILISAGSSLFVEGGFSYNGGTGSWDRACAANDATIIQSPQTTAVEIIGSVVELRNLTVTTKDGAPATASTPAESTYGVTARNHAIVALRGVVVQPGMGGQGIAGSNGGAGSSGLNSSSTIPVGDAGTAPACTCVPQPVVDAGADAVSVDSDAVADGDADAIEATDAADTVDSSNPPDTAAATDSSSSTDSDAADSAVLVAGAPGVAGSPGASQAGTLTSSGFVPGDGPAGETGGDGVPGYEGGPSSSITCYAFVCDVIPDGIFDEYICAGGTATTRTSAPGACGCGGNGGQPGDGGAGGGASIGVFVDGPSVALELDGATITTGNGGAGGAGGAGGVGGAGGTAAAGASTAACTIGCTGGSIIPCTMPTGSVPGGAAGTNGGLGGRGGPGAKGAGGPSWPVAVLEGTLVWGSNATSIEPGNGGPGGIPGDTSWVYRTSL